MPLTDWEYEPAADLANSLAERLQGFPREPHLWIYLLRSVVALVIRGWLRIFHRLEVRGADRLPLGRSFVLVANHQSHLDTLCLTAAIPLRYLHRVFPAAAADYFFESVARSAFSSIVVNGLPFDRKAKGVESLAVCRRLLETEGNVLVIFPEGTRSPTGELGRFRSGIGRLVEGSDIPVLPCHLSGAFRALPKGAGFPRPAKLLLRIGQPKSYSELEPGRSTVRHICSDLREAVVAAGRGRDGASRQQ